jgi:hypothetical protein
VSTTHAPAQQPAQRGGKQKTRGKQRSARTPEPKEIISGAGHPLDPGVRRELEARLGHDFSRVRVHTDRDSAALTELVGADAVTVGQDIFFREGAFQPGTQDGRRLLAHELLHTVQAPNPLGALRAGRDLGGVSLPLDAIERQAEAGARSADRVPPEATRAATPGWLRYARADADQFRTERLDPATLVDRLTSGILRSLRGDPTDTSGRVRLQLSRFTAELESAVLNRLEQRLPSSDYDRVLDLVEDAERQGPAGTDPAQTPEPVTDAAERTETERDQARQEAADKRESQRQQDEDEKETRHRQTRRLDGSEKEQREGAEDEEPQRERGPQRDGKTEHRERGKDEHREHGKHRPGKGEHGKGEHGKEKVDEAPGQASGQTSEDSAGAGGGPEAATSEQGGQPDQAQGQQAGGQAPEQAAQTQGQTPEQTPEQPGAQQQDSGQQPKQQGDDKQAGDKQIADSQAQGKQTGEKQPEQKPAAAKAAGSPEEQHKTAQKQPVAGSKPHNPDHLPTPRPGPVRPEHVDKIAEARDSSLVKHGLLDGDDEHGEPREEEQPEGLEAGAENEIETPGGEHAPEAAGAAETELKPEDFLPSTDLDVSSVPTADQMKLPADGSPPAAPAVPSFPAPPATKAEKVQAQRAEERDEDEPAEPEPAGQPSHAARSTPEPGPVAEGEAEGRTARDLQSEKPVDQEVGPDPESAQPTAETPEAEPETPEPAHPAAPAPAPHESAAEHNERQEAERAPASVAAALPHVAPRRHEPAGAMRPHRATGPASGGPAAAAAGPVGAPEPAGLAGPAGPGAVPATALRTAPSPAAEQADAPGTLGAPGAQPAPGASLEPGGGACAGGQQPSTEADKPEGSGGGCSGGGGGAVKPEEKPAPPDVSNQDPQAALATAGSLPPDQTVTALNGVDGAVDHSIGQQQAQLKAAPPTTQRPSGAPQTQSGPPQEAAPAEQVTGQLERVAPQGDQDQQQTADPKQVEGQNPADQVQSPNIADSGSDQVSADDVQNTQSAMNDVPTDDPALNVTVGPAPQVELTGDADPTQTDQQADKYNDKTSKIQDIGRQDVAKPMGEDRIYPDVPKETLKGNVPGGAGGSGGGAQGKGAPAMKPGVAAVVQQERGPQIKSAVAQGQGQMGSAQAKNTQDQAEARQKNQADIDKQTADNAKQQTAKRGEVGDQAKQARDQWQAEQDQQISDSNAQADQEHSDKNQQILAKRDDTNKQVQDRQASDNKDIQDKRQQAQQQAQQKKDEKKDESSGGFWGWVKSKIKAAFNVLLDAITKVFDYFRSLVNDIINKFKQFVDDAIDACRNLAVGLIKAVCDTLISICDTLLAAFPALRDKFRKAIEDLRDAAIAAVNKLADTLKAAVNTLLDALGAALNALLKLAEATLKAIVNVVRSAVEAAISFVEKAIAVFGQFAALIGDIAPDPGGWLKKMGAAALDGIQHHLWGAVKTAVKAWFDQKVESIVGLTSTLLNILIKGCISLKKIGQMAWQAVIAALPMMLAQIIIEKVVSMIVPAAGAIMTIIQGLMAAWNTISKIIAAFGKFFAFLKAVKAGPAACLFAEAVAAGVVALLEFVTNYLLSKLKSAGKAVGTKLKALAQKIMQALAKAGKGARKAVGNTVNRARTSLRNAATSLRQRVGLPHREPAFAGHPHEPHTVPKPSPEDHRPPKPHPDAERPKPSSPKDEHPDPKRPPAHEDQHQPKHEPEPTKPHEPQPPKKPTRPRPPTSRVGRALNGAKRMVEGALTKARNAARALGRKLKNSKLGRAITNGARKIRDAYKRQRDRVRDWWNKRKEQRKQRRDERRRRENSPQAKQERLAQIVEKIRPRISGLLHRGVRDAVLRGVLGALRLWYRLTELTADGERKVDFRATLNPTLVFLKGVAFVVDDLLSFVHKVGAEIQRAPAWARRQGISGTASAPTRGSTTATVHDVSGYTGDQVQELMRSQSGRTLWRRDLLRYQDTAGMHFDVSLQQWFGRTPKNRGVMFGIADRAVNKRSVLPWRNPRKKAKARSDIGLGYDELSNLFGAWKGPRSIQKQRLIARNALDVLAGAPPREPNPRFTLEVATLMVHQETLRNVGTAVTGTMLLDMAARGHITLQEAAAMHPMGIGGAKKGGEELHRHLVGHPGPGGIGRIRSNNPSELSADAREVRLREVAVVEAWMRSLQGEIVVDSQETGDEKRREIRRQIRERMHRAYGIDPAYTALRQSMDG